jgi:hypothetical protein
VGADAIDDPASPTTAAGPVATAPAAPAASIPPSVANGSPAVAAPSRSAAGRRGSGREASTVFATAFRKTAVARAHRPQVAASAPRDRSGDPMPGAAKHRASALRADAAVAPAADTRVPSLDSTTGVSASLRSVVTAHDGRPARSAPSSDGRGGLPVPSPFGPPGRGSVAGASGVASAAAGSGAVSAILVAGLLLLGLSQLRRFRLAPVLAGPVGFVSLQQRPG